VFLYIVETSLEENNTNFAPRTFAFLQVCKRWNEIAIRFPQLWVWRIPGTIDAWDLFESRSQDAPIFLTWRTWLPEDVEPAESALNILMNTETPRRIRQLDFSGTYQQLESILRALDSRSTSSTSSIRLQCFPYNNNREHLTRFFSLSFPKLSKLDVHTFLPDFTSPILTTSILTSLKLDPVQSQYTLPQLLQVLQQHPNLKQLNLTSGKLPSVENSGELVPVLLPHLVDLRLCGASETIKGLIDLISMSSPLHNVTIDFQYDYPRSVTTPATTTKKLLSVYYGCEGLEHLRKVTHLTFSSATKTHQIISAKSQSTTVSHPTYNFQLHFHVMRSEPAQEIIHLFPMEHVREYDAEELDLVTDYWCETLRRMGGLLHLRLHSMAIEPVLAALYLNGEGAYREAA
jgi:hypothetical protein